MTRFLVIGLLRDWCSLTSEGVLNSIVVTASSPEEAAAKRCRSVIDGVESGAKFVVVDLSSNSSVLIEVEAPSSYVARRISP